MQSQPTVQNHLCLTCHTSLSLSLKCGKSHTSFWPSCSQSSHGWILFLFVIHVSAQMSLSPSSHWSPISRTPPNSLPLCLPLTVCLAAIFKFDWVSRLLLRLVLLLPPNLFTYPVSKESLAQSSWSIRGCKTCQWLEVASCEPRHAFKGFPPWCHSHLLPRTELKHVQKSFCSAS